MVEWWCPEIHTFHLLFEECTITLKDMTMQLGLPVDGDVVMSSSKMFEPAALYYHLLGHSHGNGEARFNDLVH